MSHVLSTGLASPMDASATTSRPAPMRTILVEREAVDGMFIG